MDHGAIVAAKVHVARSPHWPHVEHAHLARHPHCVACALGSHLDAPRAVHHIFPFHFCVKLGRPDLELDDRNLITLCCDEKGKAQHVRGRASG